MLQIILFFQKISLNPEHHINNCLENMILLPVMGKFNLLNKNIMHPDKIFSLGRLKEKQIFGMNSPLRNSLLH